jgi:hypothetical protein
MKLSSKFFDKNHISELKRYTNVSNRSLHVISSKNSSINTFMELGSELLVVENEDLQNSILKINDKYDLIVITDLFELTDDIYSILKFTKSILTNDGKLLVISVNPKWNRILKLFEILKLKTNTSNRSYIHPKKIGNIARSTGFDVNQYYSRQIFPFFLFGIGKVLNKILEFLLLYFNVGIKNYLLFGVSNNEKKSYTKSIIIPAKNEEKNLVPLLKRIPSFNENYELIVVYGHSHDNTEQVALNLQDTFNEIDITVFKQSKNGKANAVWEAVDKAKYDLIAILDSDISVDPETLFDFFEILESGNADFVNGTRLIYPMEDKAMRAINTWGNKIFQFLISIVIGQNLTDSLCGTKVFKKSNIKKIKVWQDTISAKDPFGDFDLLFSSAFSGDKILEYPVHYRARVYGETQISRFKDGYKLIRYFIESFYLFNITK